MNNKQFASLLKEWKNSNKTENSLLLEFSNGLLTEEKLFLILEQRMNREFNLLIKEGAIDQVVNFIKQKVMNAVEMAKKAPKVAMKLLSSLSSKASKLINNRKVQKAIKIIMIIGIVAVFFASNEAHAKVAELNNQPEIYLDAIRGMLDSMTFALDSMTKTDMDPSAMKLASEARTLISNINSEDVKELTQQQKGLLKIAEKGLNILNSEDDKSTIMRNLTDLGGKVSNYAEQAAEKGVQFTTKFTGSLPGKTSGGDAIGTVAQSAAKAAVNALGK